MYRRARHASPWASRILALTGVAAIALGLVLLPSAPRSLAVSAGHAHPSIAGNSSAPDNSSAADHGSGSAVTVKGPRMLNPATINPGTGKAQDYKDRSTVTVSQTQNLTNQTIDITWTHFTPTTAGTLPYNSTTTDYPVAVAQCRVAHPKYENQCFAVQGLNGTPGGILPAGAINTTYTTTTAKGTGQAQIALVSEVQNQWLGCQPSHACSLAIIPVQGGNIENSPYNCSNHALDFGLTATAGVAFGAQKERAPLCSWDKRIIIPLHFAPTLDNCQFKNANFTVLGSPMLARAMEQWDIGLCESADPLFITYQGQLPEPTAIQSVQEGEGDVALTTQPAASLTGSKHHYTYAPVSVSAVSVAYWVDNAITGEPFTHLKLSPRLVAKLLTTSYNLSSVSCTSPPPSKVCDPGVDGNPDDIIVDRDFLKLNPHINELNTALGNATAPGDVPIVQSGPSDMTYEVTRWIAANKQASDFLADQPDQWGMRINSYYSNIKYPTNAFVPADPTPQMSRAYSPIFPLSLGVSDMLEAWPPGTGYRKQQCATNQPASYCRLTQELPGQRVLFGVLDNGDTAAFQIPSAALLNPAGQYVTPTARSMAAALNSMTTASNGITQQVSTTSTNKAEYPLTMVIYAMVPTSGLSHAKADDIARWLRYVAGPAQVEGTEPGQLPVGYLPLTPKLRAETLTAADKVEAQDGAKSTSSPSPSSSATTSASTSPSPGASVSASVSPSTAAFPTVTPKVTTVAVRDPASAGVLRYALPLLLLIGGLAALGGAASLVAPNSAAIAARLRRLSSAGRPFRRKP
jgi:hypothetical protein